MGDRIRETRESRDLSTQAAAAQAEISPGYLFKLEHGYVGTPSPRVLFRLAHVLGLGYWELMDLAGYVVPADRDAPVTVARPAEPADPLSRIATALEEIRDELRTINAAVSSRNAD
jgi:transcriptional regulator with XRE-family HTH domain